MLNVVIKQPFVHKLEGFVRWLDKLVDLGLAKMLPIAMVEWVRNCQPSKPN